MLRTTALVVCLDASKQVDGRRITARTIVIGKGVAVRASGHRFVNALMKSAPRNRSDKASN
jgi:hypothetical protein